MIDLETLKANFKKFCEENGLMNSWVTTSEYYTSDNFFEKNDHVWDEISYSDDNPVKWEEHQENLEIDLDDWFSNDYPECPDNFPLSADLYDSLNEEGYITDENENMWIITDEDSDDYKDFDYSLETKTYCEASDLMKELIDDWWNNIINVEYIQEHDWIAEALGISYFGDESYSRSAFIEDMAYWTIYFEPRIANYSVAWKCGLMPFKYYDTFMLALGGCRMDLSPRLDAYQALTINSVPENSSLFRDRSYFKYVVGKEITEEVLRRCKRENMKITFDAEVKSEE